MSISRITILALDALLVVGSVSGLIGCSDSPSTKPPACGYTEQHDKSNNYDTAIDTSPPAGPESSGLTLGPNSIAICGNINPGNYMLNVDNNSLDGDSYQFTVNSKTTGVMSVLLADGSPPQTQVYADLLTLDDNFIVEAAEVGSPKDFDLAPGTYIAVTETEPINSFGSPISQSYPYEIVFTVETLPVDARLPDASHLFNDF